MAKAMKQIAVAALLLTFLAAIGWRQSGAEFLLPLAITFGTTAYHFLMRLAVGTIVDAVMHNHADLTKKRYRLRAWEPSLYRMLQVKRWKNRMPTYSPETFSPHCHSWQEIAEATCQSEEVHRIIVCLSFLPLAAIPLFGAWPAFVITSILAAAFDLSFVILQRYNRDRILKILQKNNR